MVKKIAAFLVTLTALAQAKELHPFQEFLAVQATCSADGDSCNVADDCCNSCCSSGVCVTSDTCGICIAPGNSFFPCNTATSSTQCCSGCCLEGYCQGYQSCEQNCVVNDDSYSYCTDNDQCCGGCCSANRCVDIGIDTECIHTKSTDNTWFIMVFFVLIPLLAILFIVILVIYCIRAQSRKKEFNKAQQDYLKRTDLLAS